ncbi:MAG: bifunctional hydroxymethylpyrimidine kinase/phosphomethylpyrimidine kinase [Anaerolineales bacterium]|nr:bifunctional hydroxymethylpyrimidine kinase/phosphomethylpyrimidine kinase [Anaerolineales bacterium]
MNQIEINPVKVLTIAGSDSGGAVGLQADLRTFAALGAHGLCALTVATAQNSLGVTAVYPLPPAFLAAQLDAVFSDYGTVGDGVGAVKTGFLARVELIEQVAAKLSEYNARNVVVDPVLVNYQGVAMFPPEVVAAYREKLLPLATAVSPNPPVHQPQPGCVHGRESAGGQTIPGTAGGSPLPAGQRAGCCCLSGHHTHLRFQQFFLECPNQGDLHPGAASQSRECPFGLPQ